MSNLETIQTSALESLPVTAELTDVSAPPIGRETVISSDSAAVSAELREMWRYRELMYFLVWRDMKARYKQTVLGAAWAILRPLLTMVVFTLVFGKLAQIPSQDVPYAIFVYAGLLPWTLFSGAVSEGGVSLISQAHLFTKIYFPRVFVPASRVALVLVDFALAFVVYLVIMLFYMRLPGLSVVLLPVLLAITLVLSLGLSLLLSAMTVVYRDFRNVIPFMMQTWMYLSPVVYPPSMVPPRFRWILILNPMTGIIDAFRSCLLNQPLRWGPLGVSALMAAGIFAVGLFYFRRTERRFADIA